MRIRGDGREDQVGVHHEAYGQCDGKQRQAADERPRHRECRPAGDVEGGSYRGDQQDKEEDDKKFSDWLAPVAAAKDFDEEDYREAEVGAVLEEDYREAEVGAGL